MEVLQIPTQHADSLAVDRKDVTVVGDGLRTRAHWRHQAGAVSISGTVDDACSDAKVPWAPIHSPAITRVQRPTGSDAVLPVACALSEAIRRVTAVTRARRQLALLTTMEERHAV